MFAQITTVCLITTLQQRKVSEARSEASRQRVCAQPATTVVPLADRCQSEMDIFD
jgi:hypothetical protein